MRNAIEQYNFKKLRGEIEGNDYYESCVNHMNDDIREEIHSEMSPCLDEEFLKEYCKRHLEKFKYEFII